MGQWSPQVDVPTLTVAALSLCLLFCCWLSVDFHVASQGLNLSSLNVLAFVSASPVGLPSFWNNVDNPFPCLLTCTCLPPVFMNATAVSAAAAAALGRALG